MSNEEYIMDGCPKCLSPVNYRRLVHKKDYFCDECKTTTAPKQFMRVIDSVKIIRLEGLLTRYPTFR